MKTMLRSPAENPHPVPSPAPPRDFSASATPRRLKALAIALALVLPVEIPVRGAAGPRGGAGTNAPAATAGSPARTVYRLAEIIEVHHEGNYLAAMKEYNQWMASGGAPDKPIPQAIVEKMYKAAGEGKTAFKTVASLIQNGIDLDDATATKEGITHKKILDQHNVGMAQMRDTMIDAVINEVAQKNGWIIGRSDSGNVKAGIKSDLDQTFYVFDASDPKQLKRLELKDGEFIQKFKDAWKEKHPNLSIEMLDIASIEGRNRFPDPRQARGDYLFEFDRVIRDLRATPGAYTTQGAVVQQMQFRALEGILKENPRMFQLYGPVHDEHGKPILGADGRPKFDKWPFEGDTAVKFMFGTHPELLPGLAFGAALANFLELQHYLHAEKFEVKYHLRTYEDALIAQFLAAEGYDKRAKQEYADMDRALRNDLNDLFLNKLFPNDAHKRQLHALAMDISADFRLLHKNKPEDRTKLSEAVQKLTPEQLKDPKLVEAAIFDNLAKKLYKTEQPTPEQIKSAVEMHRKLASEFCLESTYHTSAEAFRLLLQPDGAGGHHFDIERYRCLLPRMEDAQWAEFKKQQGQGVLLTFLYGLYDLGWSRGNQLVDRLIRQNPREFGRFLLERLTNPAELKALRGPAIVLVSDLATKAHSQVAWVLGHEHFEHGKAMNSLFRAGADGGGRNLGRGLGRFVHEAALDPGNLDGLLQVWRVAIETRGDMSAIQATALDQLLFAVPIGGQIYAATQGGIPGAFLMGAAMYYPPLGIGLLAVSMAESGYAIYDLEYQKPALGNLADALYRGFVGPETRSYPGDAPPQFTDAEQKELSQMQTELGRLQNLAEPLRFGQWLLLSEREATAWHNASRAAAETLKQRAEQWGPKLQTLEAKKKAFEEFSDGSWAGGYTYGLGAQLVQKPCTNHILQFVQPVICFSPAGIVDFKAQFNPATDGPRLAELERTVQAAMKDPAADVERVLTLAEEHADLTLRSNRWSRAQRYLDLAYGRSTSRAGLTKREQAMPVPELIHRIKRDSILPEFARAEIVDLPKYVDTYLRTHANVIPELHSLGLLSREALDAVALTGATPDQLIPASVKKELSGRLSADFDRSREMFLKWKTAETNRLERQKIELRNRITAYRAQEAGAALGSLRKNPRYEALFDAIRLANVPRSAPVIKSTIFKLPLKNAAGLANPADEKFKWQLQLSITADPDLYYPPYTGDLHLLDLNQLRAAVASGTVGKDNDPLLPQVREQLRELLNGDVGRMKNDDVLVPVVTVFAAGMADLSKANPATVRHLPGYTGPGAGQCDGDDPDRDGDANECADGPPRRRVMMGQTVHVGTHTSGAPEIDHTDGSSAATQVFFRSPQFLKGPGEGAETAKFRLARALSENGPWLTVREQEVRLGYDHAPFYPREGTIARRQSVLTDLWGATNAPGRETFNGTQSAWYRVGEVLASGQEVWSAPRGPGPAVITLRAPRWPDTIWLKDETNQFTLTWATGGWGSFQDFTQPFRLTAFVHLADQPPHAEGVDVRAQWLGKEWHFFSRPTNATDGAYSSRAVTALDLPVPREATELVLSSAMFGRETHRRLRITPEFPAKRVAELEANFTNKFLTPAKFQEMLLASRALAAKEISNAVAAITQDRAYWQRELASAAQRGDADRLRDVQKSAPESEARLQRDYTAVVYRTMDYGQGYYESKLATPIRAATEAGHTAEAIRLWETARDLYASIWKRPILTDTIFTNAYHNWSSNRIELTPRAYDRNSTYAAASVAYWQIGDLDAAYELIEAEGRLRVEQLRLEGKPADWPENLRQRAWENRASVGKLEAAVAHRDAFEKESLRRRLARTEPPTEAAARRDIVAGRPYWYLAVKNGAQLGNYGPAPSTAGFAAAAPAATPAATETSRASAPPPMSLLGIVSDPFKYDQPRTTNNAPRDNTAISGGALPSGVPAPRSSPPAAPPPSSDASAARTTSGVPPVVGSLPPASAPPAPPPAGLDAAANATSSPGALARTAGPLLQQPGVTVPSSPTPFSNLPGSPSVPAPIAPPALPANTAPAVPQPGPPPSATPLPNVAGVPPAMTVPGAAPQLPPPGTPHPATVRGYSKMWQGDVRSALAEFRAAAEANPNDLEARRMRGTMELLAGDPAKARLDAEALVLAQPNNAMYQMLRGQVALWQHDPATATQRFAVAWRLDPQLSQSLYQQGAQFLQSGSPAMAYLTYLTVTYMDPRSLGAYYGLGTAAARLGMRDAAINAFENYLRGDATSSFANTARQWLTTLRQPR